MTRGELSKERAMMKARERFIEAEKVKDERIRQLKEHLWLICDIMTAILLVAMVVGAFFVDAFGLVSVPEWIFGVGFVYLIAYVIVNMRRYTTRR